MKNFLNFTKMHGCGNDYIYFDCFEKEINDPGKLSIRLSDRHFSVGGDGIILICKSDIADAKMRMFNADGSEGKMCGNGIRCVGKYIFDHGITNKEEFTIETLSGIKKLKIAKKDAEVRELTVDMGKAEFGSDPTHVSMGNPHHVIFTENIENLDLEKIGPKYEKDRNFKDGVNTEFIEVLDRNILKMRVWERGSGETLACGTGACAAVSAAVKKGICDKNTDVNVKLKGGDLKIKYTDEAVYMTGPAEISFEGRVEV